MLRGKQESPFVVLLDTLGELSACWGLADIAFVGGSLTKRGGQNMIEACAYGAAVVFGPNTWNFRHVVEMLRNADGAAVVEAGDLTAAMRRFLCDPTSARAMGARARNLVLAQQGATAQTVDILESALSNQQSEVRRAA